MVLFLLLLLLLLDCFFPSRTATEVATTSLVVIKSLAVIIGGTNLLTEMASPTSLVIATVGKEMEIEMEMQ